MNLVRITITVAILTLAAREATAADQAPQAKTVKEKAQLLEKKAADGSSKTPTSPAVVIKKDEAQAVDPSGAGGLNDAITCLSRTIYWEARGADNAGMEAIANVVMNRVGHDGFPDTVCGVVKQGREKGACQFSWWCDRRSDEAKDDKTYDLAKEVSRKALNGQLPDRTGGALYFHQRTVAPSWSKKYIKTAKIGTFVFYKPHGAKAK
jgi:spore germination cell wall hydrolase CwlJ-like protein